MVTIFDCLLGLYSVNRGKKVKEAKRPKVTVHKSVVTIQGRKLFMGGNYSRKYSTLSSLLSVLFY